MTRPPDRFAADQSPQNRRKWERIVAAFMQDELDELRSIQRTGARGRIFSSLVRALLETLQTPFQSEPVFDHIAPNSWYIDFSAKYGLKLREHTFYNPDFMLDDGTERNKEATMDDEAKLIETLQRIEALFVGATTPGERDAAANALQRMRARLKELQQSDPPIEYKFTLGDMWSRRLFVALLRRYGIRPYRYYKQRYTTVMCVVSRSFVDETLWPEFEQLDDLLRSYLDNVTNRIITEGIYADSSEPEIRQKLLATDAATV